MENQILDDLIENLGYQLSDYVTRHREYKGMPLEWTRSQTNIQDKLRHMAQATDALVKWRIEHAKGTEELSKLPGFVKGDPMYEYCRALFGVVDYCVQARTSRAGLDQVLGS